MYYTHKYSNEKFDTFEECKKDLLMSIDICEYSERLDFYSILFDFFRRKSNDDFCENLECYLCEVEEEIENDLISKYSEKIWG